MGVLVRGVLARRRRGILVGREHVHATWLMRHVLPAAAPPVSSTPAGAPTSPPRWRVSYAESSHWLRLLASVSPRSVLP